MVLQTHQRNNGLDTPILARANIAPNFFFFTFGVSGIILHCGGDDIQLSSSLFFFFFVIFISKVFFKNFCYNSFFKKKFNFFQFFSMGMRYFFVGNGVFFSGYRVFFAGNSKIFVDNDKKKGTHKFQRYR